MELGKRLYFNLKIDKLVFGTFIFFTASIRDYIFADFLATIFSTLIVISS